MSRIGTAAVAAMIVISLVPSFATASPLRRHKGHGIHHVRRDARGPVRSYRPLAADDPHSPYADPGAAIRAQAQINQYAPGVTNELAPENKATATGGPSGGVPGFSGH